MREMVAVYILPNYTYTLSEVQMELRSVLMLHPLSFTHRV